MQLILNSQEIHQKLVRIAHQILESTYDLKKIYLGGIVGNGILMAKELAELIQSNGKQEVIVFEIKVNKATPWEDKIELSIDEKELKDGYILLCDDVLNSGKTMQYALVKILEQPTMAIATVAMVDRKHRRYPIKADFVGLSLSTTLKERVEIKAKNGEYEAYLV
ncbi:MAG: phosphoribosyltransferase family protein [Crocinitomicaceae bacterium]|nr:phosphoribosyltransferase family protein [Crocinitomicaceae bacterium]MDG2464502.1 phosphoribosyltransferase family protein [Crocinitomicaceae bacterium]